MKQVDYRFIYRLVNAIFRIRIKGSGRLSYLISRMLLSSPKRELIITTLYGYKLRVDPYNDKYIDHALYYTGTYESGTLYVIKAFLRENDCFIDVGANIGLMTLHAAQSVGKKGKVIAFEANPDTCSILKLNISLNNIDNIVTHPFALGANKGIGKLYINRQENRGEASLLESEGGDYIGSVPINSLDAVCNDEATLSMIKIDVEGFEVEVLRGASSILARKNAPALIVECGGNMATNATLLFDILKVQNEYLIYKLKWGKRLESTLVRVENINELPQEDNIFCFKSYHLNQVAGLLEG